jgi:signal peptidase I
MVQDSTGFPQDVSSPNPLDSAGFRQNAEPRAITRPAPVPQTKGASVPLAKPGIPAVLAPSDQRIRFRKRMRVMATLIILLMLIGVNLAIGSGKLQFDKVISESMEPTLMVGDVILSDANAVPKLYDIVVAQDPEDAGSKLVKRVMGLPGQQIMLRSGILYIDGREEYSTRLYDNQIQHRDMRLRVPQDTVFLVGDYRNNSVDSFTFGPVPYENIRGVVYYIMYPLSHTGKIPPLHDPKE